MYVFIHDMDTGWRGEREGGTNWEAGIDIHYHVLIRKLVGSCCMA